MVTNINQSPIILASASVARQKILRDAGIKFQIIHSSVDEEEVKLEHIKLGSTAAETALALAIHKARSVSLIYPDKLVVGADQILESNGQIFNKPKSMKHACRQLKKLRGNPHNLFNAVSLAIGGCQQRNYVVKCNLKMRNFSDAYMDWYLEKIGNKALQSPGSYQIESLGVQLFDRINGDQSAILGLPLLPLLSYLRDRGYLKI